MKTLIPLGPNLIVKADISEKKSAGGLIIASEGTREAQAPEEVEIVSLGEDSFSDLKEENRPTVGDLVGIARYEGKTLETRREGDKTFEYRVIADTRILAIIKEIEKEKSIRQ